MMGGQVRPCPIRLCNVPGFEDRCNDVVYCGPIQEAAQPNLVVFFGGDVQDFAENMRSHRDNVRYVHWNLENTGRILQEKFVNSHIIVIRPSRMEYKTFSCYENFVPCAKSGAPEHTPMHYSLIHLEKLICNLSERLHDISESDLNAAIELSHKAIVNEGDLTKSPSAPCNDEHYKSEAQLNRAAVQKLPSYDLRIVAFSKGCVVLNQFLYEFHYYKTLRSADSTLAKIVSRIKDMYWLDGGHTGGKNTWITSRPLLQTLSGLEIKIHVHVTPYQIQDERRPWIKKEEKSFSEILKRQGADIDRTVHYENMTVTLDQHFDLIKTFM